MVSAFAQRTSGSRPAKVSIVSGTRARASGYGHRGSPYAGWPFVPVCLDGRSIPAQLSHAIRASPRGLITPLSYSRDAVGAGARVLPFPASPALSARYPGLAASVAPGARSVDRSRRDLAPADWIRGPPQRHLPPASSTAALARLDSEASAKGLSRSPTSKKTKWDRSLRIALRVKRLLAAASLARGQASLLASGAKRQEASRVVGPRP